MIRAGSAHNTLQRCSRPLSRSQTTTPHRPKPTHADPGPAGLMEPSHSPPPTPPPHPPPGSGPARQANGSDSSEPQQCAPTHRRTSSRHTGRPPHTSTRTRQHRDRTRKTGTGRGMSMIPLVNTTTIGATRTVTHRGACSLERR